MDANILKVEVGRMPPNFRFLGALVILIGASLVYAENYWGLLIMLPSSALFFYKEGYIFELDKEAMCNYSTIAFITWYHGHKSIKGYSFLSVVRVGVVERMSVRAVSNTQTSLKYKLTMIKDERKYFKILVSDYYKVFSIGKKIANHYNIGLVDYSKGEANWVIPKRVSS